MKLHNDKLALEVDETSGAIVSFRVAGYKQDFIGEKRLAANFRMLVPLQDYMCNYIDGMEQRPTSVTLQGNRIDVQFDGLASDQASYDIRLSYSITLDGDAVSFRSRLENRSPHTISEFWFPRLGGWTDCFDGRDAMLASPGYHTNCRHDLSLFKNYPGGKNLGSEAAEYHQDYPGMTMPWWDIHDAKTDTGLYMGYHDTTYRYSTWHTYLHPARTNGRQDVWLTVEEACGLPVGLVFSHVRYPFLNQGDVLDGGEFIIRVHQGDWHQGSDYYREWFMKHFPFDKSESWLRKKSAWFSSIIYQPEDKIIANYETYDQWCREAEAFGVDTFELIGWDKGGLERDYPDYFPEEKLGGKEGFRKLMGSIKERGSKSLVFVNYNILDSATEDFKQSLHKFHHRDEFGLTPNWMAWGESTLTARKGISVRRHVLASVVPEFTAILEKHFLAIVEAGADGFQIDKLCVGTAIDRNPLNTLKPDVALAEGLIDAIADLFEKCRAINPNFRIAAEAIQDRLIPYIDVYYRNAHGAGISPLKYVFPEWTSCNHVNAPYDYNGINGSILSGAVICVEPQSYSDSLGSALWVKTGEYIREVERIRGELKDIIFLGRFHDNQGARVTMVEAESSAEDQVARTAIGGEVMIPGGGTVAQGGPSGLVFAVHGDIADTRRAIVVVNESEKPITYRWSFLHREVSAATLYAPFAEAVRVPVDGALTVPGNGIHIIAE